MASTSPGRRQLNLLRTRERIVEATVALHTTVGPARTTITGIAERAGVQRHTVYAHFPDERDLYRACFGHWLADNPVPDHGRWEALGPLPARAAAALEEVYAYWERTADELAPVARDIGRTPALAEAAAWWHSRIATWIAAILGETDLRGRAAVRARGVTAHALGFATWRSLTDAGLRRDEAAALMAGLIASVAG